MARVIIILEKRIPVALAIVDSNVTTYSTMIYTTTDPSIYLNRVIKISYK